MIPFSIRLLGASFYGGYHYFQKVGRTFVVITSFRETVLIKAEHTNCLVTPRNSENFINAIREKLA